MNMGVWGEGSNLIKKLSAVWRQSLGSHPIPCCNGIPSSKWVKMFISGALWLRFWGAQAYLRGGWAVWVQSHDGFSFVSGRCPSEWPGIHPIILAHLAAMAGGERITKPKKSAMKVMTDVLLFISTYYPGTTIFFSALFDTRSTMTNIFPRWPHNIFGLIVNIDGVFILSMSFFCFNRPSKRPADDQNCAQVGGQQKSCQQKTKARTIISSQRYL